ELMLNNSLPPRRLDCLGDPALLAKYPHGITLDGSTGEMRIHGVFPPWKPFVPLADGQPVFRKHTLLAAQCRGDLLAVLAWTLEGKDYATTLRLFRGPDGIPLAEYPCPYPSSGLALSNDGRLVARQILGSRVEVREPGGNPLPVAATFAGRFSPEVRFSLYDQWLLLKTGKRHVHELRVEREVLRVRHIRVPTNEPDYVARMEREFGPPPDQTVMAHGKADDVPDWLRHDPERFSRGATSTVIAVVDRYGQLAILDAYGDLVCMFFVFRDRLSGW